MSGSKYQFLVSAEHEAILSIGVDAEIGGTGPFAAFATRNCSTVFARILIFCFVEGLIPGRTFRLCFTSFPNPSRSSVKRKVSRPFVWPREVNGMINTFFRP